MGKIVNAAGLGEAVRETLLSALQTGRLVTGGLQCAHVLENDPLSVMLCVVPRRLEQGEELTLSIQRTLTEAFCLEYELNLLEVDEGVKLARLLQNKRNDLQSCSPPASSPSPSLQQQQQDCCRWPQLDDLSCLLVLWSRGPLSPVESQLLHYCDDVMRGQGPSNLLVPVPD